MTSVYLAARYSRREELCHHRDELRALGYRVDVRWLDGDHQVSDSGLSDRGNEAERIRFANEDLTDLEHSDWCISFTEIPRTGSTRGGRHVEFGFAFSKGLRCVVIGHRENVFHCLPDVEFFASWDDFRKTLVPDVADAYPT